MQAAQDQRVINLFQPIGFDQETLDLMHEIDRTFAKFPFFHCTKGY